MLIPFFRCVPIIKAAETHNNLHKAYGLLSKLKIKKKKVLIIE